MAAPPRSGCWSEQSGDVLRARPHHAVAAGPAGAAVAIPPPRQSPGHGLTIYFLTLPNRALTNAIPGMLVYPALKWKNPSITLPDARVSQ